MSLITCDKVSLSYDGRNVVSDLSFSVECGDYLCVVGENGSGKSTLIKALLGLKAVSSGSIVYGDGLTSSAIGYLPQKNEMQKDFPASVREVVLSGRLNSHRLFSFYTKEDKIIADGNMEKLGISELKNRSYSELSGGQQQRVLLARALCATKKLLLLDEPVTGLDPEATTGLYSTVRQLNKDGITIIMVSHDLHGSLSYANKILQLYSFGYNFSTPSAFRPLGKKFLGGEAR